MRASGPPPSRLVMVAPSLALSAFGPRGIRSRRLMSALPEAGYDVQAVTIDDGRLEELGLGDRILCAAPGAPQGVGDSRIVGWRRRLRAAALALARLLVPLPDRQVGWAREVYRRLRKGPRPPGLIAVYAVGAPFSALALGASLARRWGVPLIADIGDPWPRRGPAELLVERWTLRRARALVVPTEGMAEVHRRRGSRKQRVIVAPNGADVLLSDRRRHRPLFSHVGVLSDLRVDPGPAFTALAALDREGLLEFASYGGAWVPLPPEAAHHHHGPLPPHRARRLMAESTAVLIVGNRSAIQVPSKTFEVARSDVWGLLVSELEWEPGAQIIEDTAHGEVVRENTVPAIREAALSILRREGRGERPQPATRYSWEETLSALIGLVDDVTQSRSVQSSGGRAAVG